jgi:LPXTG-motif cell wall-anchored protein
VARRQAPRRKTGRRARVAAVICSTLLILLSAGPAGGVVVPGPSLVLVSSNDPSVFGESVTFTATVTETTGDPVTTGTVTFFDGANPIGGGVPVMAVGQATFTTSSLSVGTHSITATHTSGATDSIDQVVSSMATATTVVSTINPSLFGDTVTFTVTVIVTDGPQAGLPVTGGTVSVSVDSVVVVAGIALDSGGQATFTTSSLGVGSHEVLASYSGTVGMAPGSDSLFQVVNGVAPPTTAAPTTVPSSEATTVSVVDTVEAEELPLTGLDLGQLVLAGLSAAAVGSAFLVSGRRRRDR